MVLFWFPFALSSQGCEVIKTRGPRKTTILPSSFARTSLQRQAQPTASFVHDSQLSVVEIQRLEVLITVEGRPRQPHVDRAKRANVSVTTRVFLRLFPKRTLPDGLVAWSENTHVSRVKSPRSRVSPRAIETQRMCVCVWNPRPSG